ncbi:hypothetical protein FRC08_009533 [Ceratobasidium sp. 394]|nr:hypothetical protein FRC08_009533 [Ceratobasidium sp. 394]
MSRWWRGWRGGRGGGGSEIISKKNPRRKQTQTPVHTCQYLYTEVGEVYFVPSRGPEVAVPWFQTTPISSEGLEQITGVQLSTVSHDQGWVTDPSAGSWTWFDIHIVVDEISRSRGKARSADSTTWTSHRNRMGSPTSEYQQGLFFDSSHEMFSALHAGDRLEVTANARFPQWMNYAEQGFLQIFVRWVPSPEMTKLIYGNILANM